ncbi:MNIO family bufferin maturase [Gymnodinialimonas sp.]
MRDLPATLTELPQSVGIGYKARHFSGLMDAPGPVSWLEIHAENYMGDGGRPLAQLRALAERFPISAHGVGLSIGGDGPLNRDHLARLKHLCDWLQPASFSEHLAWSTHDTAFLNDLLPLPYTQATLARVADHIDEVQDTVGRRMLLENPSTYLAFTDQDYSEVEFLKELAARTGCGLLLDVNNVFVSATNQGYDPTAYINAFPLEGVGEIHLGGHDEDADDEGRPLLIDNHAAPVVDPVWDLYAHTIAAAGPRPTLIEWDTDVPPLDVLQAEAARAAAILSPEPVRL